MFGDVAVVRRREARPVEARECVARVVHAVLHPEAAHPEVVVSAGVLTALWTNLDVDKVRLGQVRLAWATPLKHGQRGQQDSIK